MKATDTRYYYNADENLCADEEFAVYFLCEMEGLTAEEALEGLRTKREFYGWFDTVLMQGAPKGGKENGNQNSDNDP